MPRSTNCQMGHKKQIGKLVGNALVEDQSGSTMNPSLVMRGFQRG